MTIYPAIDIIGGECVRLVKGDYSRKTTYDKNPVEAAKRWEMLGGEFIHIVDLDGAKHGNMPNFELISDIAASVSAKIEVGGGIRNMECIDSYLSAGVYRVILGTSALNNPDFVKEAVDRYGDRIAVGIDAKDGRVAISGWEYVSDANAVEFAKQMENIGVRNIIYTDIETDGMLKGTNLAAMREMVNSVNMNVVASGGIATLNDIDSLKKVGVEGAIIGKALYTGDIDLRQAILKGRE